MPINEPLSFPKPERKVFDPIEEDIHEVSIKDVEVRQSKYLDEKTGLPKDEVNFTFEITEGEFKGRLLWRSCSPYIAAPDAKKQSVLTIICDAAYGHAMTFEEREKFYVDGRNFLNDLIGRKLRITVKNNTKGDKTFSNAVSFLKSKTPLEKASADTDEVDLSSVPF